MYKQVSANHPDAEWSMNILDHTDSTVDEDVAEFASKLISLEKMMPQQCLKTLITVVLCSNYIFFWVLS